jgi:hypothetical protein
MKQLSARFNHKDSLSRPMSEKRETLRHFLASIAYHATKAIKDAPGSYPETYIGKGVRTPRKILSHISGVLTYAHSFLEQYDNTWLNLEPWEFEVQRFYEILSKLDKSLRAGKLKGVSEEQLLQGPLSDAMAHVGQLLMLRRMADAPVPSENFIYADIRIGVVGPDQPEPVAPDK